jgi:hypothetical protein
VPVSEVAVSGEHTDNRQIHELRLFVEASEAELEEISDQIEAIVCGQQPGVGHGTCRLRWFIVSHPLEPGEASRWEDLLND